MRLASLCPIHAAITATGTPCRCISVAQVCRAACSLICRSPAASTASRQYLDSHARGVGLPGLVADDVGPGATGTAEREPFCGLALACRLERRHQPVGQLDMANCVDPVHLRSGADRRCRIADVAGRFLAAERPANQRGVDLGILAGDLPLWFVAVEARNSGRLATEVEQFGWQLPNGRTLQNVYDVLGQLVRLPVQLGSGGKVTMHYEAADIRRLLREEGVSRENVRPYVVTGTGVTRGSQSTWASELRTSNDVAPTTRCTLNSRRTSYQSLVAKVTG